MQWDMPKCAIFIRSLGEDVPLTPEMFELHYHADSGDERWPRLRDLLERLGRLGFDYRGVPVGGVCAFELARRRASLFNGVMIEFSGGGADWLEHLVTMLESVQAVNAEHSSSDQSYDPCSI